MNKIIGYARVSTSDQNLSTQIDFLHAMGCHKIFQEKISATAKDRSQLQKALKGLGKGDCLIVLKLDRLGRSVKELIRIVDAIKIKGAHLKTSDGIDTSTAYGIFVFHIFSALAEMELALIRERTKMGLLAAKMRGRVGGRPRGISALGERNAERAERLYLEEGMSVEGICSELGICRGTLYKYLKIRGVQLRGVKGKGGE
jgi:DNA invertase Pin-like site-specific DNA recombinase